MSPTKTEEQFQTTGHRPQFVVEATETRGMRILRDRSVMHKGLCSNCEKLESCSYPSTISDTWFCEEYSYAKPEPLPKPQMAKAEEETEKLSGLCMNCDLRETCKLPKAAGGVWFCGEYQ